MSEAMVRERFHDLIDGWHARMSAWGGVDPACEITAWRAVREDVGPVYCDRGRTGKSGSRGICRRLDVPQMDRDVVVSEGGQGGYDLVERLCRVGAVIDVEQFYPHAVIVPVRVHRPILRRR